MKGSLRIPYSPKRCPLIFTFEWKDTVLRVRTQCRAGVSVHFKAQKLVKKYKKWFPRHVKCLSFTSPPSREGFPAACPSQPQMPRSWCSKGPALGQLSSSPVAALQLSRSLAVSSCGPRALELAQQSMV